LNLQHWVDQHPTAFAAIFPIYFFSLWLLIAAIISFIDGWFSLAKAYRTRLPFDGAKWRTQSGQMRSLLFKGFLEMSFTPLPVENPRMPANGGGRQHLIFVREKFEYRTRIVLVA
jgi:hypothetical protein